MDERFEQHVELTPGEQEVLRLLARGFSDEAMAKELSISFATVSARMRGIHEKTGLHYREVVVFATQHVTCCGGGSGAA